MRIFLDLRPGGSERGLDAVVIYGGISEMRLRGRLAINFARVD